MEFYFIRTESVGFGTWAPKISSFSVPLWFPQKLHPCDFCCSHLFCMKNPLLQNMKHPESCHIVTGCLLAWGDEFLQRAAHQLHNSCSSLSLSWPDLWLQCAAPLLSCFSHQPLQKGWKSFMQALHAAGVKLIFTHCCKLLNCLFFLENVICLYCSQTNTGAVMWAQGVWVWKGCVLDHRYAEV